MREKETRTTPAPNGRVHAYQPGEPTTLCNREVTASIVVPLREYDRWVASRPFLRCARCALLTTRAIASETGGAS